jgi:AcrR family transcriptional regulator
MDLLAETGDEDAVSLQCRGLRVGVSVPSIYLHFADKQALLDAVCQEVFVQLDVLLREAGAQAQDPFDALRRQGNAYVHFAVDNPEHYRIVMMKSHSGDPHSADALIATGAFGYLVESVRACIDAGIFEGDESGAGAGLWAASHGVASLLVVKPYFPWRTWTPHRPQPCAWPASPGGDGQARPDNTLDLEAEVALLNRLRD